MPLSGPPLRCRSAQQPPGCRSLLRNASCTTSWRASRHLFRCCPAFPVPRAVGGSGAGGAVYLTSNAGFTRVVFQGNAAPSGGAVGVGQSSSGIYFNGCTFSVRGARTLVSLACRFEAPLGWAGWARCVWRLLLFQPRVWPCSGGGGPPGACLSCRATRQRCLGTTSTWRAGWPHPPTSTPSPPRRVSPTPPVTLAPSRRPRLCVCPTSFRGRHPSQVLPSRHHDCSSCVAKSSARQGGPNSRSRQPRWRRPCVSADGKCPCVCQRDQPPPFHPCPCPSGLQLCTPTPQSSPTLHLHR